MILLRTMDANPIIIRRTAAAPRKAPTTTVIDADKLNPDVLPMNPPNSNITTATPRLDPALIPRMPESAKGLRNAVCSKSPDTAIPIPVNKAVTACGYRTSRTICSHDFFIVSSPKRICKTESNGILTEPTNRLAKNKSMIPATSRNTYFTICVFKFNLLIFQVQNY